MTTFAIARHYLETIRDDTTVPMAARATIADWLARIDTGREAVETTRAERDRLTAAIATTTRTATDAVAAMMAAGRFELAAVAPELPKLREAHQLATDRLPIVQRALSRSESAAGRCLGEHAAELVPWIAHQRASVPMAVQPAPHVVYAWNVAARSVRIVLPLEAWFDDAGLPTIRPTYTPTLGHGERWYFAWCCIRAGAFTETTDAGVTSFVLAARWDDRASVIAEHGTEAMPAPARRFAMFARSAT